MKRLRVTVIGWAAATLVLLLRLTCRVRLHNDPRPRLRAAGVPYVYAVLHAHQVAAILDAERGTGAMVSRSRDGEILVPALRIRGVVPVRGSGGRGGSRGRGGEQAIDALVDHVRAGQPAYLAVDGPRGPRGRVQRGIAVLARRTGAVVVCLIPVPRRRLILRSWDRLQIPWPFTAIDAYFAEPLVAEPGESGERLRRRVEDTLHALERDRDASESTHLYRDSGPIRKGG